VRISGWRVVHAREPMVLDAWECSPRRGEVVVRVAGCGVCHTDLGFYHGDTATRHPFPLVLGHEVSGTVVEAGEGCGAWLGAPVVVPAVIPCGSCEACRAGRGAVCARQVFPGCDVDGGFASHVRVPAQGLCRVPDLPAGIDLAALSVLADAVSTPYQAIRRSGLGAGDVAVFVGVGGIGGFGVQLAAALGAHVVALDVSDDRLAAMREHGAALTLNVASLDSKALRKTVRAFAAERGVPTWRTRVFETSGTDAGQKTAFELLGPGGYLSIVGFSPRPVEVRLSNLMAFDATVQGNWGCLPELYPEIVELVLSGRVVLEPFVERRPLSSINATFADIHARRVTRRVILLPEA
jgi:6-hydroxycyclohex-1-ene-1-carbonyl-CoA dehydrogenase